MALPATSLPYSIAGGGVNTFGKYHSGGGNRNRSVLLIHVLRVLRFLPGLGTVQGPRRREKPDENENVTLTVWVGGDKKTGSRNLFFHVAVSAKLL